MDLRFEIAKLLIEIDRLNTLRNFTRQPGDTNYSPLSWKADRYLKLKGDSDVQCLLYAIAAYAALARGAGEAAQTYSENPEWLLTFNRIGERLFFSFPEYLSDLKRFQFNRASSAAFLTGWRGDSLPTG